MESAIRTRELKLVFVLFCFLSLKAFYVSSIFISSPTLQLDWSRRAAEVAEAVASISCSGHGRAFLDSNIVDGRPACECNACYASEDCSRLLPDCPANADGGDPLFLEPYWHKHAASSAVVMSGWHRMSYSASGKNYISIELERHVRLLHQVVRNAVVEGRFITFGAGSTQLINAAVYALSPDNINASFPASVVASIPYYPMYKGQTILFDSRKNEWKGVTSDWVNATNSPGKKFIEFVTSPNNPDGQLRQPVLAGSSVIHDHAYYWPHYSSIPAPADEDVMLFTISKVSGHASSRFGWAIVKNETIYNKMVSYLGTNTFGVSRDTQLRMLQIFKVMLAEIDGEGDIFKFGYEMMKQRWAKLSSIVSSSNRFSLQQLSPQYSTYFKNITDPSPAYAWVKCEMKKDTDCEAVLRGASIISRGGATYEADSRYTRLSLIRTKDDFDQLVERLGAFVSKDVKNIRNCVQTRIFRDIPS